MRIVRSPRSYRSVGILLDRGPKPSLQRYTLMISLWWVDVEVAW